MKPTFTRHILILSFVSVLTAILLLSMFWYSSTVKFKQSLNEIKGRFEISRLIHTMSDATRLRALAAHRMLLMDDTFDRVDEEYFFKEYASAFLGARENLFSHDAFNEHDKKAWDALTVTINEGGSLHSKIVSYLMDEDDASAINLLRQESKVVQDEMIQGFNDILVDKNNEVISIVKQAEDLSQDYLIMVILTGSVAFLLFLSAFILAYRYITRSEIALIQAHEREKTENAYKTEFMARASHELRTPLNSILGFAQVINMESDGALPKEYADYFKQIEQSGWQLLTLLDNIMDLTRIYAHDVTLNIGPANLRDIMDGCIQSMEQMANEHNVKLECLFLDDDLAMIESDFSRLNQILNNLMSNAIKYNIYNGSVTISVNSSGENRIRIDVSNTGAGIEEQKIGNLFKPFATAENMHINDGRGIGLVLTKGLVECLNGQIGVESKPGEITRFWVDIPRVYNLSSGDDIRQSA